MSAVSWPRGITSAGVAAGIKGGGELDVGLLAARRPVPWAGVFTRNAAAAAPVQWSRAALGRPVRAIAVNSGNANACTGTAGDAAAAGAAAAAAAALGCDRREVLVASTGPIGVPPPIDRIAAALPAAVSSLSADPGPFARSILTTDTRAKIAAAASGGATIVGVAKGAAMLAPDMATMLAFVATDASVHPADLQRSLFEAVDVSFNSICVDACESTNDSVFALATGAAGDADSSFDGALRRVCAELAAAMAADAEGATKVVRVRIAGAHDRARARALARAVAASVLWRAAAHGGDPNWGRVVAALGAADRDLDLGSVSVALDGVSVFVAGEPAPTAAVASLGGSEVEVECRVGDGPGDVEVLSADISPAYVELNAHGTT